LESKSEHPIGKAIAKKVECLIPGQIEEFKEAYECVEFKNRDGEGVVASIKKKDSGELLEVICGNDKLIRHFKIDLSQNDIKKQVEMLEQEGQTVVMMAVNNVPQMIITMDETHLAKPEAQEVLNYLRNVLKLKIAMITGDN